MKAYINKGTKIKWENSPSAPEFTDERIKQAVDAYFPVSSLEPEQGQFLMWDDSYDNWAPHTPMIDDNTDVTTNNPEDGQILVYDSSEWGNITPTLNIADDVNIVSPAEGDTLVYDATAGEWKNVPKKEWELIETLTGDGTGQSLTSGILPEDTEGIYIVNTVAAGAADVTLVFSVTDDDSNYTTIAGITNGIGVIARNSHVWYFKDSNLWRNYSTNSTAATNTNGGLTERLDAIRIADNPKRVRVSAPSGTVIPDGSTFAIYAKH